MTRWIGLTAVWFTLAGCVAVQGASGSAARSAEYAPPPAAVGEVWPARWGDGDPGLGKGVIIAIEGPLAAWQGRRHGPWHRRLPRDGDEAVVRALAAGRAGSLGYRYRMEGEGAFVFERDPDAPPQNGEPGRSEPAFMFVFASGTVAGDAADPADLGQVGEPHVDIGRTWFAFYDHRSGGDEAGAGKGLIVLLPGLFGVPEDVMDIMVASMRQHGWSVLRMLAPPARFVERADVVLDPADATGASVRAVADLLMDRVAETAYSAEAARAHVLQRRPGLAGRPCVVVGGSAGAMSLPAVVMRAPGAYDAAVLIAGGENILEIVARSSYTGPVAAMDFEWAGHEDGRTPDVETIRSFAAAYLDHAPLDGAHAAPSLAGLPVLMLHASMDDAVPADTGDRLWKRLGEPERWVTPGTHLTLFLSLWLHTPRIMAWLDEHVAGDRP